MEWGPKHKVETSGLIWGFSLLPPCGCGEKNGFNMKSYVIFYFSDGLSPRKDSGLFLDTVSIPGSSPRLCLVSILSRWSLFPNSMRAWSSLQMKIYYAVSISGPGFYLAAREVGGGLVTLGESWKRVRGESERVGGSARLTGLSSFNVSISRHY
jgi:hypothetical protein